MHTKKETVRITYNWYNVVKAWQLLLKEVYLVEFRIPIFLQVYNCFLGWLYEFFIIRRDIVCCHAGRLLTLSNCVHNVCLAIKGINLHLLVRVEELQIMHILVGRRNLLLLVHVLVHVPARFGLRYAVALVWEIKSELCVHKMCWHFEITLQTIVGCVFLREHAKAADGHLSNCHRIVSTWRTLFLLLHGTGVKTLIDAARALISHQAHLVALLRLGNELAEIALLGPLRLSVRLCLISGTALSIIAMLIYV